MFVADNFVSLIIFIARFHPVLFIKEQMNPSYVRCKMDSISNSLKTEQLVSSANLIAKVANVVGESDQPIASYCTAL